MPPYTGKIGAFTRPLSPILPTAEEALVIARTQTTDGQDILVKKATTIRRVASGKFGPVAKIVNNEPASVLSEIKENKEITGWQAWGRKRNPLGRDKRSAEYHRTSGGSRGRRIDAGTGREFILVEK